MRTISNLDDFVEDNSGYDGKYEIIQCKRALSPSGLPEMDFALNPYTGCDHGCLYCYAPGVTHRDWDTWRVVRVKINIADRLSKEIKYADGTIGIGTVTDPYQRAETKFELTRRCLQIISLAGKPIHMHTKSDLILRDTDLLSEIDSIVGITVTGIDDRASKIAEPGAPLPARRLEALKQLTSAGIRTYALIGPILSHLEGNEESFIDAIARTGTTMIYLDKLNMRNVPEERLTRRHIFGGSPVCLQRLKSFAEAVGIECNDVF